MTDIKAEIVKLKKINFNNERMKKIQNNIKDIKAIISNLESNTAKEKSVLDAFLNQKKEIEKKLKEFDLEMKTNEEKIKDLNIKKNSVETQKEFDAMTIEIKNFKKKIDEMEDFCLKGLDELKELNEKIKNQEILLKNAEQNYNDKKIQLLKNICEYEQEYEKIKKETEEVSNTILTDIKKIIEKISARRNGIVLSAVVNGSCEICGFNLPLQLINEIRTNTKLYQCPACSRILFYEEEKITELKK